MRHVLEDRGHADIIRIGQSDRAFADIYHHALTIGWREFVGWALGLYLAVNVLFGALYMLAPGQVAGARAGHFADYFFFSVQTFTTVGYGLMAPVGGVAHGLVTCELLGGMLLNALVTGLVFARFARPKARIMFSERAVMQVEGGSTQLSVRMANRRLSPVLSVDVEMFLSRLIALPNGRYVRQFDPLQLVQSHIPVLRFAFMPLHLVDAASPLVALDVAELRHDEAEIIVSMTGIDEISGQSVFARSAFGFDRLLHNHRFVEIIAARPDGRITVDYTRFHETEAQD